MVAYEKFSVDLVLKKEADKGVGTRTLLNFSDAERKRVSSSSRTESTNEATVAHELQHVYDYDQNNYNDFIYDLTHANRPQEIRAFNLENLYRFRKSLGRREHSGEKKIDPKKLKTYK